VERAFYALVYIPLLGCLCITVPLVLAYLAHCLLTIVEQTGSAAEAITWPDDSLSERFLKAIFLAWLGSFTIPVGLLLTAVTPWPLAFGFGGGVTFGIVVAATLLLPWLLVSSLSAESRWLIVSPSAIRQLLVRPEHLSAFYVRTLPLGVAAGLGAQLLPLSVVTALPVGAALAAALFIYARLIGQLALVTSAAARPRRSRRRTRPRPTALPPAPLPTPTSPEEREHQPATMPPVVTPEGEIEGYGVVYDDGPPVIEEAQAAERRRPPDLDDVPYDVNPAMEQPNAGVADLHRPDEQEVEMASNRKRRPKVPPRPWTTDLLLMPWRPENLLAWLSLSGGLALVGAIIALMVAFRPVDG
jgi:hypothetical protein